MADVIEAPPIPRVPVAGSADHFPVHRIYCVGRNYAAHIREMGFDPDREPPFFFCKPADAVVVSPATMPYPRETGNLHHEIECVIAIGKGGKNIPVEQALDHVFGYAVGLDMTRRDQQFALRDKGRPWDVAKAFDVSAPIGSIVPAAQCTGLSSAAIWLTVDGVERQRSTLDQLIWSLPEIIAELSRFFDLMPGDLIFTGTPEGVGPVEVGQVLEGGIDGLGTIRIVIGA